MRTSWKTAFCCAILILFACGTGWSEHVMGKVTSVYGKTVTASFPVSVEPNAIMIIRSGEGDSVAGSAVSKKCVGTGPYVVTGEILFVSDSVNLAAGKEVYVNSTATLPAPSCIETTKHVSNNPPTHDLKLYYYAAGQNVGYGTVGLGYEKTLRVSRGLGVELDGGITAVGNVSGQNPDVVNTDQLIKSLNGRLRFDCSDFVGFYSAYRWSQGRGDENRWTDLASRLVDKEFIAPSSYNDQTVMLQGLEYGMTLRPWNRLAMSFGFIPQYRVDYGTFGVCTSPAYTGELRFGTHHGGLRLRGIKSDDYWQADLGFTIR